VYQHIRGLDADTDDAAEQAHLSAQSCRGYVQPRDARLLYFNNLLAD
jgi:hypothetical protein